MNSLRMGMVDCSFDVGACHGASSQKQVTPCRESESRDSAALFLNAKHLAAGYMQARRSFRASIFL